MKITNFHIQNVNFVHVGPTGHNDKQLLTAFWYLRTEQMRHLVSVGNTKTVSTRHRSNVGPTPLTLSQHWSYIGTISRVLEKTGIRHNQYIQKKT